MTVRVPAERSICFWGYVYHQQQRNDEAYQETQNLRPAPVSHPHHPLSQGSGRPPLYGSAGDIIPQPLRCRKTRCQALPGPAAFFWKFSIKACKFLPILYNRCCIRVASEASANHSDGRRAVCPATAPRWGRQNRAPEARKNPNFQPEQEDET